MARPPASQTVKARRSGRTRILKKRMVDQDVLTLARARCQTIFDRYERVAVSFSGGKDSMACLEVVIEAARERGRLPVTTFFWDQEAIHPETVDYMTRTAARPEVDLLWLCLRVACRNGCSKGSPTWYPWAAEEKDRWCRPMPDGAIRDLPGFDRANARYLNRHLFPQDGRTTCVVLGFRAVESISRYRSIAQHAHDNWIAIDKHSTWIHLAKPIYDWSIDDVWTAAGKFGWDYNRTYDLLHMAGVPVWEQRVSQPFAEEPIRSLWEYATCWPDLFQRMIDRVPGSATAARLARTPAYCAYSTAGWLDGGDPRERVEQALARWPADKAARLRVRIDSEIHNHYSKTPDPIPTDMPGPSGISWRYLFQLASRGDFRRRNFPMYTKAKET